MKNKSINFILISMLVLTSLLSCRNVQAASVEVNRNVISSVELVCDGDVAELVLDVSGYAGIIGFSVEKLMPRSGEYTVITKQPFQPINIFDAERKISCIEDNDVVAGEEYHYRITAHDNRGREIVCGLYDVVAGGHQAAPAVSALRADATKDLARSESSPYQSARSESSPYQLDATTVSGSGTVVNICVTNDGLFTVSASNIAVCLSELSLPDVIDAIAQTNFVLTCRGESVSWLAGDNSESLLFYGSETSTLYQAGNVYQLRVGSGVIIPQESVVSATVTNGQSFIESLYFEEDGWPFTAHPPPLYDFWIWNYWWNSGKTKDFGLELQDISIGELSGVITTHLMGYSEIDGVFSNHHVRISCNGMVVSDQHFTGFDNVSIESTVTNLVDGTNTVSIEQVLTNGVVSVFLLKSFDVSYNRQLVAYNDALVFDNGIYSNVTIHGFSTNTILLFDITDEKHPVQLSDSGIGTDTNGLFGISFVPQSISNVYLATVVPLEVCSMKGVAEVDLLSVANEADYILLTTSEFIATAQTLVDQREAQGLNTMLLDIEQVYDVFADGFVTPYAIKGFLSYAYSNWNISPKYVVLGGAGNWDFIDKNQDDPIDPCLIPPLMYYVGDLHAVSSGWVGIDTPFGDVEGDTIPEIIVGRLPAKNVTELSTVISKIISYENQSGYNWKSNVSILADNEDSGGAFHYDSDILAGYVPASRAANKIYLTNSSYTASVRAAIIDQLNSGVGFLSYLGHGNMSKVADENLINNVSAFSNLSRPAMMLAFTCELGRFAYPSSYGQSLSENMITSDAGGFVAVWAPASISFEVAGIEMASQLFDSIFKQSELRIGDAIKYAFENFSVGPAYHFLFETFEFQGDPATIISPGVYSFNSWREEQFTADDLTNSVISDWDADPDGDGINNLEEYNGGTNPTNYNERAILAGGMWPVVSGSETNHYVSVNFPQVKWSLDVNTYIDICYDLMITNWFDATESFGQVDQEELNAQADRVTLQLLNTNLVERKMFLRTRTELE